MKTTFENIGEKWAENTFFFQRYELLKFSKSTSSQTSESLWFPKKVVCLNTIWHVPLENVFSQKLLFSLSLMLATIWVKETVNQCSMTKIFFRGFGYNSMSVWAKIDKENKWISDKMIFCIERQLLCRVTSVLGDKKNLFFSMCSSVPSPPLKFSLYWFSKGIFQLFLPLGKLFLKIQRNIFWNT